MENEKKKDIKILGLGLDTVATVNDVRTQVEELIGVYKNQIESLDENLVIMEKDLRFMNDVQTAVVVKRDYKEYVEKQIATFSNSINQYKKAKKESIGYKERAERFLASFDDNVRVWESDEYIFHEYNTTFFNAVIEFARVFVKTDL